MTVRRSNIKRLSLVACGLMFLYIVFSNTYEYKIDAVIKNTGPEVVWDYVADFSKMRLLNPTILHFEIITDTGNTHDWRYSVLYTERLSHWPYWLNTAKGDYIITKSMPGQQPQIFSIESKHQTCFFKGFYCLRAESDFKFKAVGKDTYCIEKIRYQCPPFLGNVCQRELIYQRQAVMHNLTEIFSKKQQHLK